MSQRPQTTPSFNLLDEPWIICTTNDGSATLSIREIFDGSATPTAVLGDSPTQDYAVLRLLLAIFWRAHHQSITELLSTRAGRRDFRWEDWFVDKRRALLNDGHDETVLAYLAQYESRFDLLHKGAPFMQVAGLQTRKGTKSDISRIVPDAEHDYFTMRTHDGRSNLSFAEAARWLVHAQAYDYAGINTGVEGDPRVKNGKGYPIGTGWSGMTGGTVIRGTTLLETLLLNSTPEAIYLDNADDHPVWEREPDTPSQRNDRAGKLEKPDALLPHGPADFATWQSRRIRLFAEGDAIVNVLVSIGDKIPDKGKNVYGDPMTPYRYNPKQSKKGTEAFYPCRYDTTRTMWRSLDALIATHSDPGFNEKNLAPKRPSNLVNFSAIAEDQGTDEVVDLNIVSMEYGPKGSTVNTIVSANMGLPLQLLRDNSLSAVHRQYVRDAAEATKDAASSLGKFAGQLKVAAGGEYVFDADAADRLYTVLEPKFLTWLRNLDLAHIGNEATGWQVEIENQVLHIADEAIRGAGQRALVGRVVDAQDDDSGRIVNAGSLYRQLRYRLSENLPLIERNRPSDRARDTRTPAEQGETA